MRNQLLKYNLTDRKWFHIIGWWEIRRIIFNIILLLSGILSLIIFLFILKFDTNIIQPITAIGFGLLANFFYTFGWITELFFKFIKRQNLNTFGIKTFKIGLGFFILLTFLPTIFFGLNWAITGKKFSSPYSNYTTIKPDFNKIVGIYSLDKTNSSTGISETDRLKEIKIILNSDSSFSMKNIPIFGFEQYQKYELWNGKGKWRLICDNDKWKVSVHCDTLFTSDSKSVFKDGFFTKEFTIKNNESSYNLYQIIGDPDEWTGALYVKNK